MDSSIHGTKMKVILIHHPPPPRMSKTPVSRSPSPPCCTPLASASNSVYNLDDDHDHHPCQKRIIGRSPSDDAAYVIYNKHGNAFCGIHQEKISPTGFKGCKLSQKRGLVWAASMQQQHLQQQHRSTKSSESKVSKQFHPNVQRIAVSPTKRRKQGGRCVFTGYSPSLNQTPPASAKNSNELKKNDKQVSSATTIKSASDDGKSKRSKPPPSSSSSSSVHWNSSKSNKNKKTTNTEAAEKGKIKVIFKKTTKKKTPQGVPTNTGGSGRIGAKTQETKCYHSSSSPPYRSQTSISSTVDKKNNNNNNSTAEKKSLNRFTNTSSPLITTASANIHLLNELLPQYRCRSSNSNNIRIGDIINTLDVIIRPSDECLTNSTMNRCRNTYKNKNVKQIDLKVWK